jgi:hypothetical protein
MKSLKKTRIEYKYENRVEKLYNMMRYLTIELKQRRYLSISERTPLLKNMRCLPNFSSMMVYYSTL